MRDTYLGRIVTLWRTDGRLGLCDGVGVGDTVRRWGCFALRGSDGVGSGERGTDYEESCALGERFRSFFRNR